MQPKPKEEEKVHRQEARNETWQSEQLQSHRQGTGGVAMEGLVLGIQTVPPSGGWILPGGS